MILNYTRNPQRQFEFDLGVDAADDPLRAMSVGLAAMNRLDFVLQTPKASAIIQEVGDSNILLRFFGWVDQSQTDFLKGRSLAIQAVKSTLETAGFALPEPIYRLRFDDSARLPVQCANPKASSKRHTARTRAWRPQRRWRPIRYRMRTSRNWCRKSELKAAWMICSTTTASSSERMQWSNCRITTRASAACGSEAPRRAVRALDHQAAWERRDRFLSEVRQSLGAEDLCS